MHTHILRGLGSIALVTRGGRRSGPLLTGTMTRPTGRRADAEGATIRAFGSQADKVIVIGMLAIGLPLLALARAFPAENGSIASTKIGSKHNFNIWVMSLEQQRRASRVGERRFSEPL